jgi:hypothetical protein
MLGKWSVVVALAGLLGLGATRRLPKEPLTLEAGAQTAAA